MNIKLLQTFVKDAPDDAYDKLRENIEEIRKAEIKHISGQIEMLTRRLEKISNDSVDYLFNYLAENCILREDNIEHNGSDKCHLKFAREKKCSCNIGSDTCAPFIPK